LATNRRLHADGAGKQFQRVREKDRGPMVSDRRPRIVGVVLYAHGNPMRRTDPVSFRPSGKPLAEQWAAVRAVMTAQARRVRSTTPRPARPIAISVSDAGSGAFEIVSVPAQQAARKGAKTWTPTEKVGIPLLPENNCAPCVA